MSFDRSRIVSPALRSKIMSADDAAALVPHGANVGMSGFTGSGYPKAVPMALARRIEQAQARGEQFRIGVWDRASTAPELDGALAKVNGIELRLPYQSDPVTRERINAGAMEYIDIHLSHVAQFVWFGFSATGCRGRRGHRHPAGRQSGALDVHRQQQDLARSGRPHHSRGQSGMSTALQGMHDVYYGTGCRRTGSLSPSSRPATGSASRRFAATRRR